MGFLLTSKTMGTSTPHISHDILLLDGEVAAECDVCVVLKEDRSTKPVRFCGLCKAFICRNHYNRFDLRALTAFRIAARWIQRENS